MNAPVPIECAWDGQVFRPINSWWAKRAEKQYTAGEVLHLVDEPERSQKSHAHFFAAVNNAWRTLPETLMEQYPSADVLRKKMLIKAGFCSERSIVCSSKAEAQRVAAFIAGDGTYSVVVPRLAMVSVYTAESQSMRAMGKERFQRSKTAVLDALEDLLGAARGSLAKQDMTALECLSTG